MLVAGCNFLSIIIKELVRHLQGQANEGLVGERG